MAAFRRVEPQHAGPRALGILVPPGERTLVILRPRSLDWDLLPARWDGDPQAAPVMCSFGREEAAHLARQVHQALEDAVAAGSNPVETLGDRAERSFQLLVRAAGWFWIACRRASGSAYQPMTFASRAEARRAGELLAQIVWPGPDETQEYYFNTQRFQ